MPKTKSSRKRTRPAAAGARIDEVDDEDVVGADNVGGGGGGAAAQKKKKKQKKSGGGGLLSDTSEDDSGSDSDGDNIDGVDGGNGLFTDSNVFGDDPSA